jgi:hypothetical protein
MRDIFPQRLSDDKMNSVLWANGIYNRQDIQWYTKFSRLGIKDPYNAPTGSKEYLFFTKPDLNIVNPPKAGNPYELNPELANQPYFKELLARYPDVIAQLQLHNGIGDQGPFMAILSNSVKNTLDLPAIASDTVDTPANIYGTSYNYRSWGYKSDEKVEFSLEFEDTKYLEIYQLLKAYEEYERLKHLGLVSPPNIDGDPVDPVSNKCFSYYIRNKILHDQFSIYKFIVEDDGETIIYYAKLWGVFFKNVPRDTFSDLKVEGGLTYAVEFEAAFVDDMNPTILTDFNQLVYGYKDSTVDMPLYDVNKRMIDGSWATMPIISKVTVNDGNIKSSIWNGPDRMKHIYKLKWRK